MSFADKPNLDAAVPETGRLPFAEMFVDMLLCPAKAMQDICANPKSISLSATIALVIIVSIVDGLHARHSMAPAQLYTLAISSGIFGLFRWLMLVLSFSLAALCFSVHKTRIYAFVINSAWAQLPLLFLAPLICYRHIFGPTYFLADLCLFAWLFCLEWLAIETSFALKQLEVFCLIVTVPSFIGLCQIVWYWPVIAETLHWLAS